MKEEIEKEVTMERAELFCRAITTAATTERDKEIALIWLSELVTKILKMENMKKQ